jgi:hypothetical protein
MTVDGGVLFDNPKQHGNFYGWRQHRKFLPGEYVMDYTEECVRKDEVGIPAA